MKPCEIRRRITWSSLDIITGAATALAVVKTEPDVVHDEATALAPVCKGADALDELISVKSKRGSILIDPLLCSMKKCWPSS
jgi:hypothetical protein